VSEENQPDWVTEAAKTSESLIRQIGPTIQEAAGIGDLVSRIGPIIRDSEATRRQIEPIIRAAEQITRSSGWPVSPFQQKLIRSVEAAMRELQPPKIHAVAHPGTVEISVSAPTAIAGSLALPPMRISGQLEVQDPPGHAERSIGQILALVLVAIMTSALLGVQGPDRATVDHYLAVLSFALPIAVLIWSKQK
jgi:hypothetical protein